MKDIKIFKGVIMTAFLQYIKIVKDSHSKDYMDGFSQAVHLFNSAMDGLRDKGFTRFDLIMETIKFDQKFIKKIEDGKKIITVNLGIYKINDNLKIEIYRCEKVQVQYHEFWNQKSIYFATMLNRHRDSGTSINIRPFGFDSFNEACDYYKDYLKEGDYVYSLHFRVVEDENE